MSRPRPRTTGARVARRWPEPGRLDQRDADDRPSRRCEWCGSPDEVPVPTETG